MVSLAVGLKLFRTGAGVGTLSQAKPSTRERMDKKSPPHLLFIRDIIMEDKQKKLGSPVSTVQSANLLTPSLK